MIVNEPLRLLHRLRTDDVGPQARHELGVSSGNVAELTIAKPLLTAEGFDLSNQLVAYRLAHERNYGAFMTRCLGHS